MPPDTVSAPASGGDTAGSAPASSSAASPVTAGTPKKGEDKPESMQGSSTQRAQVVADGIKWGTESAFAQKVPLRAKLLTLSGYAYLGKEHLVAHLTTPNPSDPGGTPPDVCGAISTGLAVTESALQASDELAHHMIKRQMGQALTGTFQAHLEKYSGAGAWVKGVLVGGEYLSSKDVKSLNEVVKDRAPTLVQNLANAAMDARKNPAQLGQLSYKATKEFADLTASLQKVIDFQSAPPQMGSAAGRVTDIAQNSKWVQGKHIVGEAASKFGKVSGPLGVVLAVPGQFTAMRDVYQARTQGASPEVIADKQADLLITTVSTVGALACCFPATAPAGLALTFLASGAGMAKARNTGAGPNVDARYVPGCTFS